KPAIVRDFTTMSLSTLFMAVPMWISPLAYGGPSWSTKRGAPFRRSRICPYRSSASQRASVSGSLTGKLAFIGKSVRGRLSVSFQSVMSELAYILSDGHGRRFLRRRFHADSSRPAVPGERVLRNVRSARFDGRSRQVRGGGRRRGAGARF